VPPAITLPLGGQQKFHIEGGVTPDALPTLENETGKLKADGTFTAKQIGVFTFSIKDVMGQVASATVTVVGPVNVTPTQDFTGVLGGTGQFIAVGGAAPYTFSVADGSGKGTITDDGIFTGTDVGTVTVFIIDSVGQMNPVKGIVTSPLPLDVSPSGGSIAMG